MRNFLKLASLAAALIHTVVNAEDSAPIHDQAEQVGQASEMLFNGDFAGAIKTVDPVIASYEEKFKDNQSTIYCASGAPQTVMLMGMAAQSKKDAAALDSTWCNALFIKGFALIDLGRLAEAGPFLKKAADMAPLESHYINEYAEWHKTNRNWQQAYDLFSEASSVAEFTPENDRKAVKARSLRGMGFALIELGKLDEAEKLFKESLKLVPKNPSALNELQYIKEQRGK